MKYEIYTDGCCIPNPGNGSYGYIKVFNNVLLSESVKLESNTTNNRMEYRAVIDAMKSCSVDDEVTIYSDSQLLVNTYNKWMEDWDLKGKLEKKKNNDLVKELIVLKRKYKNINLNWIKGHSGHQWNEYIDSLVFKIINK